MSYWCLSEHWSFISAGKDQTLNLLMRIKFAFQVSLLVLSQTIQIEPRHEISNNVVCATSKASDQPAHTGIMIRAFAHGFNIL